MSKNWMMLTGLLLLAPAGISHAAEPLDSPDMVYIDGLPCNRLCQSYMAWSAQKTSTSVAQPAPAQPAQHSSDANVRRAAATHREGPKPALQVRAERPAMPLPAARTAELQPAADAAVAFKPAPPVKGVQEQIAAAKALAERLTSVTAAPPPEQEASDLLTFGRPDAIRASSRSKPAKSPTTKNTDNLVAVLIARPEVKSVSDLAGTDIAIDDRQSTSNASVRAAIVAAGAAGIELNEGHAKALDRVIDGEVPAAVLTLVSPEAAEWFPDIPGFKIFRVPLTPRH
jgi:hypothetical protein